MAYPSKLLDLHQNASYFQKITSDREYCNAYFEDRQKPLLLFYAAVPLRTKPIDVT